jgi:hypothetical protein
MTMNIKVKIPMPMNFSMEIAIDRPSSAPEDNLNKKTLKAVKDSFKDPERRSFMLFIVTLPS